MPGVLPENAAFNTVFTLDADTVVPTATVVKFPVEGVVPPIGPGEAGSKELPPEKVQVVIEQLTPEPVKVKAPVVPLMLCTPVLYCGIFNTPSVKLAAPPVPVVVND